MESSFVVFAVERSKLAGHFEYERSPADKKSARQQKINKTKP